MKKVLVIIPTYNESKTIKKIVEKIFIINREYSILVVDDSSPDGTREIVEQLQLDYKNLFLYYRWPKVKKIEYLFIRKNDRVTRGNLYLEEN